jgi:hypothetical protein
MAMGARAVNVKGVDQEMVPSGEAAEALTVSNTAVGLATTIDEKTTHVFWTVDGADVRVRFDGTDPDANTGHLLRDGSSGTWHKTTAKAAKLIRTASTDALFFASKMAR